MKQIKVLCMMAMALWASALSAQSHWQCDIAAYQNSMAVYFQLADGENIINDVSPYEVAAFVNDDCRGVATFEQVVSGGNTYKYGYLRIRSNSDSGETVHLKVFNKLTQEEKRIAFFASATSPPAPIVNVPSPSHHGPAIAAVLVFVLASVNE